MALNESLAQELLATQDFFNRSTRVLDEADSGFRPAEGMMTAAQQVAHVAQTIDWFIEGAGRPEGFDLNFEQHMAALADLNSLAAARAWVDKSFAAAVTFFREADLATLERKLPEPIMAGMPVSAVVGAIVDHTAHHRGALTVYSRLLGKVPPMPYGG